MNTDRQKLIEHLQFFFRVAEALHTDLSNEQIAERAINAYEGFDTTPSWSMCVQRIREYIDLREQAGDKHKGRWNDDLASGMHYAVNLLFDLRDGDDRSINGLRELIEDTER